MGTQLSSNPKNSFPTAAKLWNRGQVQAINPEVLPTLPIATLQAVATAPVVADAALQADFDAELNQLKGQLLQARRSAILARSQSMALNQRQALCQEAQAQFQAASASLSKLSGLARRLGVEARRKARSIEAATEWRSIRHAIQRSAELNQVQLAVAA